MSSVQRLPTGDDVALAAHRIADRIHRTPVLTSSALDEVAGRALFFKCENMQRTGSFKIRGALNTALQVAEDADVSGLTLVTHSSGNHGAALALAGRIVGIEVVVVVPENAPAAKKANIARYGARLIECGPTLADREGAVQELIEQGGHYVSPYNDNRVIAGQGTLALEVLEQTDDLQELWVPVGGGGMASGCVLGAGREVRVRGAEPELADDAFHSLATGVLQGPRPPATIADGLRGALGDITFPVLQGYSLAITRVSEAEIVQAQRLLMNCLKVVVEPSGAVGLAAVLKLAGNSDLGERVGIVISGGNLDLRLSDA